MNIRLVTLLLTLVGWSRHVDCRRITATKKDIVVRNIVRSVLRQTRSTGVLVLHVNSTRVANNQLIYSTWMRELAAVTTVATLNNFTRPYTRYFGTKNRTKEMTRCTLKNCYCLGLPKPLVPEVVATDRVLFVVILPVALQSCIPVNFFYFMSAFESAPKVLFVIISDKKFHVKVHYNVLNGGFDQGYVNFDVVEVTPRRRIGKRAIQFNYRIVQLDTAANRVTESYYNNRKTRWFKDKVSNYQARKIKVLVEYKGGFANDPFYYDFLKTLGQMANITFVSVNRIDPKFCETWVYYDSVFCSMFQGCTYVKLYRTPKLLMVVPVIFESVEVSVEEIVMLHSLVLSCILMVFLTYAFIARFDRENWPPTTVFILIFGGPTGRMPLTKAEIAALFCTIAIGFFFAGDLVSGLSANAFEQKLEIELNTFEDLQRHNVTVSLLYDPKATKSNFYQEILRTKVKYDCSLKYYTFEQSIMHSMFTFKNLSFSRRDDILEHWLPQRFVVRNKYGFRVSSLSEQAFASVIVLRPRDPLVHRASDIFWRYFETNLLVKRHWNTTYRFHPKRLHPEFFKESLGIPDDDEDVDVDRDLLLVLILTGSLRPVLSCTSD